MNIKALIKSLNDLALGNHGQSEDALFDHCAKRIPDLPVKGKAKNAAEKAVEKYIAGGGVITLYDAYTAVSIQDGVFTIHAASPTSRLQIMTDYEQVEDGTVNTFLAAFAKGDKPEKEEQPEDDEPDNADDPDYGVPVEA